MAKEEARNEEEEAAKEDVAYTEEMKEEEEVSTHVAMVTRRRKKGRATEGLRRAGPPLTFPADPGRPSCCIAAEFSPAEGKNGAP